MYQRAEPTHGKACNVGVLRLPGDGEHTADEIRQLFGDKGEEIIPAHLDVAFVFRRKVDNGDLAFFCVHFHIGVTRPGSMVVAHSVKQVNHRIFFRRRMTAGALFCHPHRFRDGRTGNHNRDVHRALQRIRDKIAGKLCPFLRLSQERQGYYFLLRRAARRSRTCFRPTQSGSLFQNA